MLKEDAMVRAQSNRLAACYRRDAKNGVAILMHLPEGQTSELEPLQPYKNAPRQRRVHSYWL